MKKTIMASMLTLMLASPALAVNIFDAVPQVNPSQKGSLLYYTNVEVCYEFVEDRQPIIKDTVLEITNDSDQDVYVQLYFVNGDDPITEEERSGTFPFELIERTHPGWNFVDAQIYLSPNKSTYWSSATGNNDGADTLQVPPFGNLDSDPGPDFVGDGRPDPDNEDYRTVRGYVVAWAVAISGEEITHNNLTGKAHILDYNNGVAGTYNAFSYKRLNDDAGDGVLALDGEEYDLSPARVQLDFFTSTDGATIIATADEFTTEYIDTDLSIMPVSADLTAEGEPVSTFVQADIWNQNETRFSGAGRCITCWDQTLLRDYQGPGILAGNHFMRANIGTDKGKARLTGKMVPSCEDSVDTGLLAVARSEFYMFNENNDTQRAGSAWNLVLQGTNNTGTIAWDIIDPGMELEAARDAEMDKIRSNRERLNRRAQNARRTQNRNSVK